MASNGQQQPLAADLDLAPVRLRGEPGGQLRVDAVAGPGARAVRAEEVFLVIADDHLRAAPPQQRDDLVRETVFVNTVSKADQLVDIAHHRKGLGQSTRIAVNVGNEAYFHRVTIGIATVSVCLAEFDQDHRPKP